LAEVCPDRRQRVGAGDAVAGRATALDPPGREAIMIMMGRRPGTRDLTLDRRRELAARLYHVQPGTFRREAHQSMLLWDLTMEIYRQRTAQQPPPPRENGAA
jgi:hypothetical protein